MRVYICSICFLFFSCISKERSMADPTQEKNRLGNKSLNSFDYLLGAWQRLNESERKVTREFWTKEDRVYYGHGFTMSITGDTLWQEHMKISMVNSIWSLEVQQLKSDSKTIFWIDEVGENYLLAACPQNDFPKQIIYQLDGDSLRAEISDGGPVIPFTFFDISDS